MNGAPAVFTHLFVYIPLIKKKKKTNITHNESTPIRMVIVKTIGRSVGEDMEDLEHMCIAECKMVLSLWKAVWCFPKIKH